MECSNHTVVVMVLVVRLVFFFTGLPLFSAARYVNLYLQLQFQVFLFPKQECSPEGVIPVRAPKPFRTLIPSKVSLPLPPQ